MAWPRTLLHRTSATTPHEQDAALAGYLARLIAPASPNANANRK